MHRRPYGGSRGGGGGGGGKNGELPTSYGAPPHSYSGGEFGASFGSASDTAGYGGGGGGRSSGSATFRRHGSSKKSGGGGGGIWQVLLLLRWVVVLLVIGFFVAATFHYRFSYKKMQTKYKGTKEEMDALQQSYQNLYDTYTSTRRSDLNTQQANDLMERIRGLERDKRDVVQELTTLKATTGATASADLEAATDAATKTVEAKYAKREGALRSQIGLLRDYIIRESYREALELFGEGPHKVEFVVELPPLEGETPVEGTDYVEKTFVVQLHSIEKMPHSVHLFLEQVSHGLWNGCSFVINAPHIIQAGALPASGDYIKDNKMEAFVSARLATLSFQEYSTEYPHAKYTLGFAGRPGGPDFYINKIDNTENHGPGGQNHHDLEEEADPCFGFVLEEYTHVVDRMATQRSDSNNSNLLVKPIHIQKAVLKLPDYRYHDDLDMSRRAAGGGGGEDHPELAHFDDEYPQQEQQQQQQHDHLDPDHHLRDHHEDEPPRSTRGVTAQEEEGKSNVAENTIEADGAATAGGAAPQGEKMT